MCVCVCVCVCVEGGHWLSLVQIERHKSQGFLFLRGEDECFNLNRQQIWPSTFCFI